MPLRREKRPGQRTALLRGAIAAAVLLLGVAGVAAWQWRSAVSATALADERAKIAAQNERQALESQSRFLANAARQKAKSGDAVTAALLAIEALPGGGRGGTGRPYVAEAEQVGLLSFHRMHETAILHGHQRGIDKLAFLDGGKLLASVGEEGTARVWSVAEGRPIRTMPDLGRILAISGDGRYLLSKRSVQLTFRRGITFNNNKTTLYLSDLQSGASVPIQLQQTEADIGVAAFDLAGERFVTDHSGVVTIWNVADARPVTKIQVNKEIVQVTAVRQFCRGHSVTR